MTHIQVVNFEIYQSSWGDAKSTYKSVEISEICNKSGRTEKQRNLWNLLKSWQGKINQAGRRENNLEMGFRYRPNKTGTILFSSPSSDKNLPQQSAVVPAMEVLNKLADWKV